MSTDPQLEALLAPLLSKLDEAPAPTLGQAVRALAGVCDGAVTLDEHGYNAADTNTGHFFARLPEESWSPQSRRKLWEMLRKYRVQLARYGIDYDAIPEPPAASDDENAAWKRRRQEARQEAARHGGGLTLEAAGGRFTLRFPYSPQMLAAVKGLPGRRWDPDRKLWSLPGAPDVARAVLAFAREHGFTVEASAADLAGELGSALLASRAIDADCEVAGLGGELLPFQKAGVKYAAQKGRCLIADEMGLGKTVEALATLQAREAFPALVICPASLKLNWEREARKWLPQRSVAVLNGGKRLELPAADLLIINYDILGKWLSAFGDSGRKLQGLVLDESHYCKNHKAQRSRYAADLAQGVPTVLLLTGTPVVNRPQELAHQLRIMDRLGAVGGWKTLMCRYAGMYRGRFGMEFGEPAHLDELNDRLRASCYVRRRKADVLPELPEKRRSRIPFELENRAEYARAERDFLRWLEEVGGDVLKAQRAEHLVRIEKLKQLAVAGKIKAARDWIESFLESGEKLVLFAHHRAVVQELAEAYGAPAITGETPIPERQAAVDRFQSDPECRLIVLNLRAGGVGLTLTAASNVAFLELGWTPAEHDQAEDRCHRIGQRDSVTAWYLCAADTVETDIEALLEAKRRVVTATTDGGIPDAESLLDELTESISARHEERLALEKEEVQE